MPHSTYFPEKMGSAAVSPSGAFEAGSYQEFTVTYTAGYFGMDEGWGPALALAATDYWFYRHRDHS